MSDTTKYLKPFRYSAIALRIAMFIPFVIFCIYYLSHSRAELLEDFLAKGGCFYRQEKFSAITFNETVKTTGNMLCIVSIPLALFFSLFIFRFFSFSIFTKSLERLKNFKKSIFWIIALLASCIAFATFGFSYTAMCTDEAFSALNFAKQPLVRLISYYPIPNNHIFFNLLNHFWCNFFTNSFVSGRVLSIVFYCLLICGNFFLFYHFTKNNFISFLCCLLLSLQFIVWGFGHQGRGYALCHLLQWIGFVCFYYYFFSNRNSKHEALGVLIFCNVIGMWTVPVYLYFIVFQVLSATIICLFRRKLFFQFWLALLLSGIGVFLVYLPAFCYSGIGSLLGGGYNTGKSLSEIGKISWGYFYDLVTLQTFNFLNPFKSLALVFFILPFILIFFFRNLFASFSKFVLLYGMIWISMVFMVLIMRQFPVFRGMGFQMHFSLLILLLIAGHCVVQIHENWKTETQVFLTVFTLFLCVRMMNFNKEMSPTVLYGQDTRAFLNGLESLPQDFKPDATVWLSDESFMWPFVLKDLKNVVNYDCNFNHQDIIFLSEDDKPLPEAVMQHYKERNRASWFIIYERK